jgi:hypothetical protein
MYWHSRLIEWTHGTRLPCRDVSAGDFGFAMRHFGLTE